MNTSRVSSLPLAGSEASKLALKVGERKRAGVGVKKATINVTFSVTSTPPPDRRFATHAFAGEG
jgi:hypothetical protein